ncbi:maestro heat-like repeat-containing protein family member 2B [Lagopus muta]|uniref:maestro heat-like repeat-containing protein family member 2B n=1 Tax=Lagopus muta TaxID=64668 RepID=UPI00209E2B10|nr:maestro heat-like repeat-containing protein family member 2B [Lagopus muta]
MPHVVLSCSPTAAWHCVPPRNSCSLEVDIVGNVLMLYSCSCQDLQNNLVQSITDCSSAFHAVGDTASFNPSLEAKLLEILMDLLKKYCLGIPVSPVLLKVVLALEQLSKLKPTFESKDMREMLVLCCKNMVTHPSAKMMLKIRKSQQAAQYLQLQQRSLKALGRLMAILLETEPRGGFFQNIVHILQGSMVSENVWERKRALQTCSQLLDACEELQPKQPTESVRQETSGASVRDCMPAALSLISRRRPKWP